MNKNRKDEIAKGIAEIIMAIVMATASLILWSYIQIEAVTIGLICILSILAIMFFMIYLGLARIIK